MPAGRLQSIFVSALLSGTVALPLSVSSDTEPQPAAPLTEEQHVAGSDAEKLESLLTIVRKNYIDPLTTDRWTALFNNARDRLHNKKESLSDALNGALGDLDPHSRYIPPEDSRNFQAEQNGAIPGLGIRFTVGDNYVTMSPLKNENADKAGIKDDDVLLGINGRRLSKNQEIRMRQLTELPHVPGVTTMLTVLHKGEKTPKKIAVTSANVIYKPVTTSKIGKDIGFIRLDHFSYSMEDSSGRPLRRKNGMPLENSVTLLSDALVKMREEMGADMMGLILDLRNNPGGDLDQAVSIAADFFNKGQVILSTRYRKGSENTIYRAVGDDLAKGITMVVLVNEASASSSEAVAGALQDNKRAVIMGTQTYGKGTIKENLTLSDGSMLIYTIGRYYTPAGHSIQLRGITPDITVTVPKNMAVRQEREADLYKALPPPDAVPDTHKTFADCAPAGSVNVRKLEKPMVVARDIPDYHVICAVSYLRAQAIPGITIRPFTAALSLAGTPAPR